MQAVHARDGLDEIVLLERLIDIQDCVARFVETSQQLVHHDQNVGAALCGEILDGGTLIGLRIAFDVVLCYSRMRKAAFAVLSPSLFDLVPTKEPIFRVGTKRVSGA